ncbi:MAG: hypothetical protein EOM64_02385 [Erysipelotrichia bacterium]|nr:hypothetical protein [Erysipelotrichia bacterium]
MNEDLCLEIQKSKPREVRSVLGDDGYPGMPMDDVFDREKNKPYLSCDLPGHRLTANTAMTGKRPKRNLRPPARPH